LGRRNVEQRSRGDDPNDADCCSHHETFWTAIAFCFIVIILVGLMAGAYWKGRKDNKQYALPLLLLKLVELN
jgi:cbb3-type cytochrome oxidase subunit 3